MFALTGFYCTLLNYRVFLHLITGFYCTQLPDFTVPAVESGDEDEGEDEEEDGGDDHHDQRDLGLGQVLIGEFG